MCRMRLTELCDPRFEAGSRASRVSLPRILHASQSSAVGRAITVQFLSHIMTTAETSALGVDLHLLTAAFLVAGLFANILQLLDVGRSATLRDRSLSG